LPNPVAGAWVTPTAPDVRKFLDSFRLDAEASAPLDLNDLPPGYEDEDIFPGRTVLDRQKVIEQMALARDGDLLAAIGQDGVISCYDLSGEKGSWTFPTALGHCGGWPTGWFQIALSPDGQTLAVATRDGILALFRVAGGQERTRLLERGSSPGGLLSLAFSPGGNYLASGDGNHEIKLWEPASGKLVRTMNSPDRDVAALAFTPDGQALISGGGDGQLRYWDVRSGGERTLAVRPGQSGGASAITALAFAPDGRMLASGGLGVRISDVTAGTERELLRLANGIRSLSFSPDGRLLAAASYAGDLSIVEVADGRQRWAQKGEPLRQPGPACSRCSRPTADLSSWLSATALSAGTWLP
jgi:WD40 repeat protein